MGVKPHKLVQINHKKTRHMCLVRTLIWLCLTFLY